MYSRSIRRSLPHSISTCSRTVLTYNHTEANMYKTLLCLSLFLSGYLAGQISTPATAQVQGFNSDGSSYLYYPPAAPGAPGQWFGSNGQSGTVYDNSQPNL